MELSLYLLGTKVLPPADKQVGMLMLLVDFAVKPTEAMVISELCTRLNVRLAAAPETSYLGRGAEVTVLRVSEINGETERALNTTMDTIT